MTGIDRRRFLATTAAAAAAAAVPGRAAAAGWVEVAGFAQARNADDRDAARRRALADALLAAALAGGAEVRGHTVVHNTRVTSDLLIVRPVGRVLEYRLLSAAFDGQAWQVRIRARVGAAGAGPCTERRRLVLAVEPPELSVSPSVPAWAAALAPVVAADLADAAGDAPGVTAQVRLSPATDPDRDRAGAAYLAATRRRAAAPPGSHRLSVTLRMARPGNDIAMRLDLRLAGPAGEGFSTRHDAAVPFPRASPLGRAAVLAGPGRAELARRLAAGAVPALERLLQTAQCRPVVARLRVAGGRIEADAGTRHGLERSHLAYTVDAAGPAGMLEIAALGPETAVLRPLDPQVGAAGLDGRAVRFLAMAPSLP